MVGFYRLNTKPYFFRLRTRINFDVYILYNVLIYNNLEEGDDYSCGNNVAERGGKGKGGGQ